MAPEGIASGLANVHVSTHPCVRAKLSQLRSKNCDARSTKRLVHEIANIVCCDALATSLSTRTAGKDETPLGYTYNVETVNPARISVVPILRSGLGMIDALSDLLPDTVAIHHLGLFREPTTLQPVEYYNNLPYHSSPPSSTPDPHLAIILDPIIATGGTCAAAIQTLREWGVSKVVVISILGTVEGIKRATEEWEEVEIWVGDVDSKLNEKGMIVPGVGDVGDRLFGTKGK